MGVFSDVGNAVKGAAKGIGQGLGIVPPDKLPPVALGGNTPGLLVPTQSDVDALEQELLQMEDVLSRALPGGPITEEQKENFRRAIDAKRAELEQKRQQVTDFFQFRDGTGQDFRGNQQDLISALQARASGQAPSAAEMLANQQREAGAKQALALANSSRGVSAGLALRQAQQAAGDNNMRALQQAAMLRAQEQARAEQALAGVLQGARHQDLTTEQLRLAPNMDLARLQQQREITQAQVNAGINAQNAARQDASQGRLLQVGATVGAGLLAGPAGAAVAGGATGTTAGNVVPQSGQSLSVGG